MSRIKEFSTGIGYVKRGFSFFIQNKGLWFYAVIPTFLNLVILGFFIFLLVHYFGELSEIIFGGGEFADESAGIITKAGGYFLIALIWIAKVVIFIIGLVFSLIAAFILSMVIVAPFHDALSEKVEEKISGKEYPFSWIYLLRSTRRSIVVGVQNLIFFLIIPLLLLILHFIPAIGSFIYLILTNLFAAFDVTFSFVDLPMSRKLWSFKKRLIFSWHHRYLFTGFGICVLIPLFPYFFSAPLVVGATIMFEEIITFKDKSYESEGE